MFKNVKPQKKKQCEDDQQTTTGQTECSITKRAVLYVGYPCNLRCKFCYYAYKPEKNWHPLDKCIREATIFRGKYDNTHVDITGGEPTIYPHILDLVRYCSRIGMAPTIITNLQALSDEKKVVAFKEAGIEDFLCSVHAWQDKYDKLVAKEGAFEKLKTALGHLQKHKVQIRANCTITRQSMQDLRQIAQFVINNGAKAINFISYNPFYEWENMKEQDFQAPFSEIRPYLIEALEYCDMVGVEANVRYYPFCMAKGHEEKMYNFGQLPWDPGEWDFKSWYNVEFDAPCHKYDDSFYEQHHNDYEAYKAVSKLQKERIYSWYGKCEGCALFNICDGLTHQYMARFGDDELEPYEGEKIEDPRHFIRNRQKFLWEEDQK